VRLTTAFNRILQLPGASVRSVAFTDQGLVIGLRRRRRRLLSCGATTPARYDSSRRRWRHVRFGCQRWGRPFVAIGAPLGLCERHVVRALWQCDGAMTSITRARCKKARCRAVVTVSAAELLTLAPISQDAVPEVGRLNCELLGGHDGSHITLVATAHGGDQWWWLRWGGQLGEVVEVIQIDPCHAKLPQGPYAEDCYLPEAHPGPHSFDLPPLPSLPGKRHPFRRRPPTP
jgi:hypothetical protein